MSLPAAVRNQLARVALAWRERAVTLKALSFALVGFINTAVDAAVFFALLGYVTSSLVVANVVAWFVAVSGSYMMNSVTTFSVESGGKLRLEDYVGFLGSGLVAVIATTTTVVLVAGFLPVWAAKVIATVVNFTIIFSITHFVVFRPKSERSGAG